MGVKQLWTLLSPVGRPVLLETMEGKSMAIDSSIWIYQFQATMRDKDGRALVNAHVLGFLRRICKLLFYGIKPVFVFDGGAPVLKKHTIAERKRKKVGAADSHAKIAQKLLAAQMRREAVLQVQKGKQNPESALSAPEENAVYLEDLVANPAVKPQPAQSESPPKKNKFHDYDPYRLPDVDPSALSRPTNSLVPDPRLATEEELREFIEAMRPEDFDVSSPAFRELPTEIQYEIIGDLRLKSRQTSHKRLQTMLRSSRTPLDFSKAQIKNLKQRNALTQQLLETTDSIGRANVVIPVRIASERNKEYVLVKNEGAEGGWVLGIQEGTRDRPIEIDEPNQHVDVDDSDDMEEVDTTLIGSGTGTDVPEYHGRMALAAVSSRHSIKETKDDSPKPKKKAAPVPLFWDDSIDETTTSEMLIQAMEAAEEEERALELAIEASKKDMISEQEHLPTASNSDDEDINVPGPSRLETALAFANTPTRRDTFQTATSTFGIPVLLLEPKSRSPTRGEDLCRPKPHQPSTPELANGAEKVALIPDEDDDMEEIPLVEYSHPTRVTSPLSSNVVSFGQTISSQEITPVDDVAALPQADPHSDESEIEYVEQPITLPQEARKTSPVAPTELNTSASVEVVASSQEGHADEGILLPPTGAEKERSPTVKDIRFTEEAANGSKEGSEALNEEGVVSDWERSSSPVPVSKEAPRNDHQVDEAWDAAEEMDIIAEEGDFAELVSQMKNQDLEMTRREIDEEIKELNKQRKVAMRDSEDVSQHMISQIMLMLRLFGLPYITAPMEAEAQCAALVSLGLVEGIITDDSDVFLFGGLRVYKNMFNQSKTVECFLLSDLSRELGLERNKLIQLAYLLGSDYVEGLPGVGPVVAMELLKEFPGEDGLHKFKEWWMKVQSGKDTESDTGTKFKKRFKKRFRNLYLNEDWPNPAVRDAYYHPTVDESEEPFKWGLPDLDALHQFFRDELSWTQAKVDELLVPIIRKIGQRNQATNNNRQGTLNDYFDVSFGSGTHAPRRRQAYTSKRLQQVVTDFRAAQRSAGDVPSEDGISASTSAKRTVPKPKAKKTTRPRKRRKKGESPDEEEGEQENTGSFDDSIQTGATADEDIPQPPAAAAKLRVRPRQRYKQVHPEDNDEVDDTSSDDLFTVKRSRKS